MVLKGSGSPQRQSWCTLGSVLLAQPGGGEAHEALANSGLDVQVPSCRPQGDKLPLEKLSSGAPRARDSRDSGNAREELRAPKGVGMFTWLLGKRNPPWEATGLQNELEGAGGQNNAGERPWATGQVSCLY